MQEKSSKNFSDRQRTPEKQKELSTPWNWGSLGELWEIICSNIGCI